MRLDAYPFLVKQVFPNFSFYAIEDAFSLVKGKNLDLSMTFLNNLAFTPNSEFSFFESYGWSEMSEVKPLQILRVMMGDLNLSEVVKPEASDLNVHRTLLYPFE